MDRIETQTLRNSTAIPTVSQNDARRSVAPVDPLLTAREAAPLLGVSVPTFWRRVADGTVPKPIKLGALSRWPQSEILAVIENAKAARTAA